MISKKTDILRLFEQTGQARKVVVSLPFAKMKKTVSFGKFEIKTLKVDLEERTWNETDLTENNLRYPSRAKPKSL